MDRDQSIFSIHNLTPRQQTLILRDINLIGTDPWLDLISGMVIKEGTSDFILSPYQSVWITNKSHT